MWVNKPRFFFFWWTITLWTGLIVIELCPLYVNLGINQYYQSESICPVLLEIFKVASHFVSALFAFLSQSDQLKKKCIPFCKLTIYPRDELLFTGVLWTVILLYNYIRVTAVFVGHLSWWTSWHNIMNSFETQLNKNCFIVWGSVVIPSWFWSAFLTSLSKFGLTVIAFNGKRMCFDRFSVIVKGHWFCLAEGMAPKQAWS